MKNKLAAFTLLVGLLTPAIIFNSANEAKAESSVIPCGQFEDSSWSISLGCTDFFHTYSGRNKNSGESINLNFKPKVISRANNRKTFSWNNRGYKYQVTYRRSQPNVIRLQVSTPSGKMVLNRILSRYQHDCAG